MGAIRNCGKRERHKLWSMSCSSAIWPSACSTVLLGCFCFGVTWLCLFCCDATSLLLSWRRFSSFLCEVVFWLLVAAVLHEISRVFRLLLFFFPCVFPYFIWVCRSSGEACGSLQGLRHSRTGCCRRSRLTRSARVQDAGLKQPEATTNKSTRGSGAALLMRPPLGLLAVLFLPCFSSCLSPFCGVWLLLTCNRHSRSWLDSCTRSFNLVDKGFVAVGKPSARTALVLAFALPCATRGNGRRGTCQPPDRRKFRRCSIFQLPVPLPLRHHHFFRSFSVVFLAPPPSRPCAPISLAATSPLGL
jgi:hypothetical protein